MKNTFLFFVLFLLIVQSFCQTPTIATSSKNDYLAKSKKQKTIGSILLASGVALTIIGVAQKDSVNVLFAGNIKNNDDIAFYILGGAAAVCSVPFFIASAKNKRKAASVGIINQKIMFSKQSTLVFKRQPTIIIKVDL